MPYDVKYYFESSVITNAITYADPWDWDAGGSCYNLKTVREVSAQGNFSFPISNPTSPWLACLGQWISAARAGRTWTPADTFDVVFVGYENDGALNASLYVIIRVLDSTLTTVRGTLYAGNVNTVEWDVDNYFSRRHADGIAIQNTVVEQAGDKLVIEVGVKCLCSTTGYSSRVYCGTSNGVDLALSDADNIENPPTSDPWIGFTYGAGAPSPIGPAGAIVSAEDVDGAAMMRGTIQSEV